MNSNFQEISSKDFDREIRQIGFFGNSKIALVTTEAGSVLILNSSNLEISSTIAVTAAVESMAGLGDNLIIGTTHGAIIQFSEISTIRFLGAKPVKILKISENEFFTSAGRSSIWRRDISGKFLETPIASVATAASSAIIGGEEISMFALPGFLQFSKLWPAGNFSAKFDFPAKIKFSKISQGHLFALDFAGNFFSLDCQNLKPKFQISSIEECDIFENSIVVARKCSLALIKWTLNSQLDNLNFQEASAIPVENPVLKISVNSGLLVALTRNFLKIYKVDSKLQILLEISSRFENVRFLQISEGRIFTGDDFGLRGFSATALVGRESDAGAVSCAAALSRDVVAVADLDGGISVKTLNVDDTAVDIVGPGYFKYASSGGGDIVTSMVTQGKRIFYTKMNGAVGCMFSVNQESATFISRLEKAIVDNLEMPWLQRSIGRPTLNMTSIELGDKLRFLSSEIQVAIATVLGMNLSQVYDKLNSLRISSLV